MAFRHVIIHVMDYILTVTPPPLFSARASTKALCSICSSGLDYYHTSSRSCGLSVIAAGRESVFDGVLSHANSLSQRLKMWGYITLSSWRSNGNQLPSERRSLGQNTGHPSHPGPIPGKKETEWKRRRSKKGSAKWIMLIQHWATVWKHLFCVRVFSRAVPAVTGDLDLQQSALSVWFDWSPPHQYDSKAQLSSSGYTQLSSVEYSGVE